MQLLGRTGKDKGLYAQLPDVQDMARGSIRASPGSCQSGAHRTISLEIMETDIRLGSAGKDIMARSTFPRNSIDSRRLESSSNKSIFTWGVFLPEIHVSLRQYTAVEQRRNSDRQISDAQIGYVQIGRAHV